MNIIQWVPLATGAATLVGAGVAGVVTYFTTRRTALTTWRSKTAEWQYEALTAFYDVALHIRDSGDLEAGDRDRLDAAWRRLELTGPESLAELARSLYKEARGLTRGPLWQWRQLSKAFKRVSEGLNEDAMTNVEANVALYTADQLYHHLDDACRGMYTDWTAVHHLADAYDDAQLSRSGGFGIRGETWSQIEAILKDNDPKDLFQAQVEAQERFDQAAESFTSGMRAWLNGRRPATS